MITSFQKISRHESACSEKVTIVNIIPHLFKLVNKIIGDIPRFSLTDARLAKSTHSKAGKQNNFLGKSRGKA